MGRLFRHDVCGGYRYFIGVTEEEPDWRIQAPVTAVVADDDTGLAHAKDEFRCWERVAAHVNFLELAGGGHYFVRGNPAGTGELIVRAWASAAELEG
jgi:surfactin synthase thioesterase subunit